MNNIVINGAREHNLKDISLEIPRNKFIVITGISGSGKSTLAFDTLYAEGQRRYVESLSAYARQFLGLMNKPDVDSIEGLSPAISIDQKTTSKNPRSTVGTITEIYDYLRLLFARIGTPYCPNHNIKIQAQTPEKIAEQIMEKETGIITILSPLIRQKKGTYQKLISDLNQEGYNRIRINGEIKKTNEKQKLLDRYKKHDIELVIDRVNPEEKSRLTEAIENALKKNQEKLVISLNSKNELKTYSAKMACPQCGVSYEELQPRMFSFNSPFGACEECHGLGIKMDFDEDLIIPDKTKSIAEGAIAVYRSAVDNWRGKMLANIAKAHGFNALTPIKDLNKKQYNILMYGSEKKIRFNFLARNGESSWSGSSSWEGIIPQTERLYHQTESEYRKQELQKYMRTNPCTNCEGKRLKEKILSVRINNKSIHDVASMPISECRDFFNNLKLSEKENEISKQILKEIKTRLEFLNNVGLNYLTLSRNASTLSGGEAQRIRLATQIGSNLTGVLYILDEPSIGLHQRDNKKLINTLTKLKELGNTILVVEHDEETIRSADHVIDMGPGAGIHGGKITAQGKPEEIERNPESLTGAYLSRKEIIRIPEKRRTSEKYIRINGCSHNNLKKINVKIPLRTLTLITGVSGSGKSTLIYETLYKALKKNIYKSKEKPGKHDKLITDEEIDKVIVIDQTPIGRTPRSNPATYIKVFDEVRKIFSETKEAKQRGYKQGRFSFNIEGGRCEACKGDGIIKIEMNFLPDVYVQCEECKGTRYNKETLQVKYKGKTISDILKMTVEEALNLFENIPSIRKKLETLKKVGLEYIELGQSATTLSGGEAQRIKLTRELAKRPTGNTIYLLDEPTTGLHFHDIKKLISVLDALVSRGNTVIIIEHNLDVIKNADYVIDLGPEGGNEGGRIIAEGTPEEIIKNQESHTSKFLKKVLEK